MAMLSALIDTDHIARLACRHAYTWYRLYSTSGKPRQLRGDMMHACVPIMHVHAADSMQQHTSSNTENAISHCFQNGRFIPCARMDWLIHLHHRQILAWAVAGPNGERLELKLGSGVTGVELKAGGHRIKSISLSNAACASKHSLYFTVGGCLRMCIS